MNTRIPLILMAFAVALPSWGATAVTGKVTIRAGRGVNPNLAETVIWLEPVRGQAPRPAAGSFQMTTRSKTLLPHILVVPVGSTVTFPNEDAVTHNLFSLSPSNAFDLGLYRRGTTKTYKFTNPGIVTVYCNVHPSMSGAIHVMQTPWYGFANANGEFTIDDLPPGAYHLNAWNEQGGAVQTDVEIESGSVKGSTSLVIDASRVNPAMHMDKHGQPYSNTRSKDY